MKKSLAILFVFIHLFNLCGYQLFFSLAEKQADKEMVAVLDKNNFTESELVQIKLPLNTPYITGNKNYERCDGQVELKGIQYNYVRRMVKNDTLYLLCIPNQQKTALKNSKIEYAKQSSDIPAGKKSEQSSVKKSNGLSEYNNIITEFSFSTTTHIFSNPCFQKTSAITTGFIPLPAQPPDFFI